MKSPQLENGYTKISNEIIEALAKTKLNGEALRILFVIIRKTYGYNKKEDKISLSQFMLTTSLMKSAVCRGLKRLINMNIIIKIDNEDIQIYRFNKDFDSWKSLTKLLMDSKSLTKPLTTVNETVNTSLTKLRHTKENTTKDNITKDILRSDHKVAGVEDILNIFYKINPTLNWGNKTTRSSAADLIKKFGLEETKRMAEAVISVQGKPYAPVATTPYQMKEKLAQFKIYFDSQKNNKNNFIQL